MRARRLVLVAATTLGGVGALIPAPASAGGGSEMSPSRAAYVPTEVAVVQGAFWGESIGSEIGAGPYVAYLLPLNRWFQSHEVPASAIPIGELTITPTDVVDVYRARVEFRVPEVPTGLYHIQYCNDPCTVRGLGDLIGSGSFAIGGTRTEGHLLIEAQRLRLKIQEAAYRARHKAADEIRDLKRDLRAAAGREAVADHRVRQLTETLGTTRTALEDKGSTVVTASIIAGGLLVTTIALLVVLVIVIRRLGASRVDAELQAIALRTDLPVHP